MESVVVVAIALAVGFKMGYHVRNQKNESAAYVRGMRHAYKDANQILKTEFNLLNGR